MQHAQDIFGPLKKEFEKLLDKNGLCNESVSISARPLTAGEAIGNPEADDYPLLKGKERMMEAAFLDSRGQAFTDMCGEWGGKISDVVRMNLENNFRRALFVASLNAVMRYLGLVERTVHCRDEGPARCGAECLHMLAGENASGRIVMVGHQPRILEQLSSRFDVKLIDMDEDNIGKQFFGVTVFGPEMTEQLVEQADTLLVTGTTLVNNTITRFLHKKGAPIFYGVTIAGAAELLGLRRFCPFGL